MTTIQTPGEAQEAIYTAANLATIELLIAPEFDNEFIIEWMETAGVEPTEENIEKVIEQLVKNNKFLAAQIIRCLPVPLREPYLKD